MFTHMDRKADCEKVPVLAIRVKRGTLRGVLMQSQFAEVGRDEWPLWPSSRSIPNTIMHSKLAYSPRAARERGRQLRLLL
jgi:hypothetical protein